MIENVSAAVTYEMNSACTPPTTPASAEEIAKATSLQRKVGTPSTSATSSSSRIANNPVPSLERQIAKAIPSVAAAIASSSK